MERWYHRDHSAEIARRYGPWLARHESYLPVDAPADARAFGFYNWRVTEAWWREVPLAGPQGALSFTLPPAWPTVAACFVPPQPTEDFLGAHLQPHEKVGVRWLMLLKYPEGVSREEGERWFLETHAPETMRQPGLYRYFSYQVIQEPVGLPGVWPPGASPPPGSYHPAWDRVSELWYETFTDWRRSVIESPPRYTRPPVGDVGLLSVRQAVRGAGELVPTRAAQRRVPEGSALLHSVSRSGDHPHEAGHRRAGPLLAVGAAAAFALSVPLGKWLLVRSRRSLWPVCCIWGPASV